MIQICIEMPTVSKCTISECSYNGSDKCHARAITVGDESRPGCDTFMAGAERARKSAQSAGIGACKMASCKHNEDLECMAESIKVGMIKNEANCITFALR